MSKPGRPSNEQRTARMDRDRERKRRKRAAEYAKRDPAEVAAKAQAAAESAARTAAERAAFDARETQRKEAAAAKAAAAVRPVIRFSNVIDGPSGSIIRNPEPVTMNPYEAPPPRREPFIPQMPANCIVQKVPAPLPPGVVRQANGIRTGGRTWSVFDV